MGESRMRACREVDGVRETQKNSVLKESGDCMRIYLRAKEKNGNRGMLMKK
jgi:hypothetical protein